MSTRSSDSEKRANDKLKVLAQKLIEDRRALVEKAKALIAADQLEMSEITSGLVPNVGSSSDESTQQPEDQSGKRLIQPLVDLSTSPSQTEQDTSTDAAYTTPAKGSPSQAPSSVSGSAPRMLKAIPSGGSAFSSPAPNRITIPSMFKTPKDATPVPEVSRSYTPGGELLTVAKPIPVHPNAAPIGQKKEAQKPTRFSTQKPPEIDLADQGQATDPSDQVWDCVSYNSSREVEGKAFLDALDDPRIGRLKGGRYAILGHHEPGSQEFLDLPPEVIKATRAMWWRDKWEGLTVACEAVNLSWFAAAIPASVGPSEARKALHLAYLNLETCRYFDDPRDYDESTMPDFLCYDEPAPGQELVQAVRKLGEMLESITESASSLASVMVATTHGLEQTALNGRRELRAASSDFEKSMRAQISALLAAVEKKYGETDTSLGKNLAGGRDPDAERSKYNQTLQLTDQPQSGSESRVSIPVVQPSSKIKFYKRT